MFIDLEKTLFFLATVPLAVGACGGNNTQSDPDAMVEIVYDAALDPTDATVYDAALDPTFSGTVSLAEVAITNPGFETVNGANITISFTDPADVTVDPQPGYEVNVGACKIYVYDVAGGESAAPGTDGGPVTVSGTSGTSAASFSCNYNSTADAYGCSSDDSAASGTLPAGTSLTTSADGTATLSVLGADFSNENYVGMQMSLSGFTEATSNGRFGIVAQPSATTLVVYAPAAVAETLAADGTYYTLIGAGPIPGGFDFLDDGSNDVTVTKAAITNAPEIDSTLKVNGSGFALAESSTLPHQVPLNGNPATFSCAGSCGTDEGFLKGIIVFGETTDGDIVLQDPTDMPDPVSSYATFQCSGIGQEEITLDAGAMALISGTNPTRIQTSVTYANAQLSGNNTIVMSHGVVGFTTAPVIYD
ncbi:MAG: hypothetical protein GY811_17260 [Myxococcales bacterium]|nr:hypothetical protein [Myxococcales bacterium]